MAMQSVWKATTAEAAFPQLPGDIDVDVAVVGGGITGISAAALLAEQGRSVAVLEAHRVGEGTTGHSTGNLYAMVDQRLYRIRSKHDDEALHLVADSRRQGMAFIEERVRRYRIDCGYAHHPWVLFSESTDKDEVLEREAEAIARAGMNVVRETSLPLPFPIRSAIRVDGQAQFNPLAYVKGLAGSIQSDTCRIYERTKVTEFDEDNPTVVHTSHGVVRAKKVIMATHTPKGVRFVHTLMGAHREYGIAVRLNGGYPPGGIFWSTEQGHHHSLRRYTVGDETFLLVVGEPHKVGQEEHNEERLRQLEEYARSRFDVHSVAYRWGGQHYSPADGLPYIGESGFSPDVYMATGFATDGLVYGTTAALLIADMIVGRDNPWRELYDPGRFTPGASAGEFVKLNADVLAQYIRDLPGIADRDKLEEVPYGEGKTVEIDGEKCAVYRDENGKYHIVSAVCTHMDCIVNWNRAERSWDCPCHGSRFTIDGEVIEGPAVAELQKYRESTTD